MADKESTAEAKARTRTRSPSYPAIDLQTAVQRAEQIWKQEGEHPAALPTIYEHWGYSPSSGSANLTIAALRKFGLLTYEGARDERTAMLTDLAVEILGNPDDYERLKAIRNAALEPQIHQYMWSEYGDQLPSDRNLRWKLNRDLGFTHRGADDFLTQYKSTMEFAGMLGVVSSELSETAHDAAAPAGSSAKDDEGARAQMRAQGDAPERSAFRVASYNVPAGVGVDIKVEGPFPVSQAQWDQFIAVLRAMAPALVKTDADE